MTLYRLDLHGYTTLSGPLNEIINSFGYQSLPTAVADSPIGLAIAFKTHILPPLMNVLHNSYRVARLDVYELSGGSGFHSEVPTTDNQGVGTGEAMPIFVAWGFRYNRSQINQRSGGKRFGPISEGSVVNGVPDGPTASALNALANELFEPLLQGTEDAFEPVILSPIPGGGFVPRTVSSVSFARVTSQNSRKT